MSRTLPKIEGGDVGENRHFILAQLVAHYQISNITNGQYSKIFRAARDNLLRSS